MKMKQLRHEMERSRTLLEMIKKREKMKKDKIEVMLQIFELQCIQIADLEHDIPPSPEPIIQPRIPIQLILEEEPEFIKVPTPKKNRIKRKADVFDFDDKESESEDITPSVSSSEYSPSEDSPQVSPTPGKPLSLEEELASKSNTEKLVGNGFISHIPKIPPFRGRARLGRGGRVIFDRPPNHKTNGIVSWWESDQESNERLNSLTDLQRSGFHPLISGRTDAEKLLKKLLLLEASQKKRKHMTDTDSHL